MIETRLLTHRYGKTTALDGLDLKVEAGELFGFIGPNGAGKTTTIQILATLLAPTSGEAKVCGLDVRRTGRQVRRLIGYMPDFFGLYEGLRVWEYLEFFAAAYEVPAKQRGRVLGDVLELTDLTTKGDAMVGALSRGMQQRLGLARVLIHGPQVLLLDEPASGLDPGARVELREILKELRSMGKTILISSHILSELAEVCTSIGILNQGRLVAAGPVDQVLARAGAGQVVRVEVETDGATGGSEAAHADPEGNSNPALAALSTSGIDGIEEVEEGDNGDLRVRLNGAGGAPEIAAFLVSRGFRLSHLESVQLDLEDAYLRLIAGEDGE